MQFARRPRTSPALLIALTAAIALAIGTAPASAQAPTGHIALRWNDCYGDGGADLRTFACNTNSGSEFLVMSVFPTVDVLQFIGFEGAIDLLTTGAAMPSWWQFQAGGCRAGGPLTHSLNAPAGPNCADTWEISSPVGTTNYIYPSNTPNRARLRMIAVINPGIAIPAGSEMFLMRIHFRHLKTVGAGSCSGCAPGLCIGLNFVKLLQPIGVGDYTIVHPLPGTASDVVSWQDDLVMTSFIGSDGEGTFDKEFTGCVAATEAARPTWGAIKRLYR